MYPIYSVIDVKNRIQFRIYILYRYMKRGYNAYNSDYGDLFSDIDFKLRLLAEALYQSEHENYLKYTKQILKFKVMFKKMFDIEFDLRDSVGRYLNEKYGCFDYRRVKSDCGKCFILEYVERPAIQANPSLKEQYKKEAKELERAAQKKAKAYKRKVMRYFLKHYENWWV